MLEPPNLADETITAALHTHYAISSTELTFLALGSDSASAVYRVRAGVGASYFLKLRAGDGFRVASLAVPRYLSEQGLPHILAPLPAVSEELWVRVEDFALTLYPFVDGRTAVDVGLSAEQWRAFGAVVGEIHASPLPPDVRQMLRREPFVPSRHTLFTELAAAISKGDYANSEQRELAHFWQTREDDIRTVRKRAGDLGRRLRQTAPPLVLCHADLHTWNVLLDGEQKMWLVDWDETILAPKERDLMFVFGGIGRGLVAPHETTRFLQGYGDEAIDPLALAYYRCAWAVQDMGEYGERVFSMPHLGQDSRRDALDGFMDMFEAGNIVEIALGAE